MHFPLHDLLGENGQVSTSSVGVVFVLCCALCAGQSRHASKEDLALEVCLAIGSPAVGVVWGSPLVAPVLFSRNQASEHLCVCALHVGCFFLSDLSSSKKTRRI